MKNTRRSFLATSSGLGLSAAAIAVPSVARTLGRINGGRHRIWLGQSA